MANALWQMDYMACPECERAIITVHRQDRSGPKMFAAFPNRGASRPLPAEVAEPYVADFAEAVDVLAVSPKASAALTRRSLQSLLVNMGGAAPKADLAKQIDEVAEKLPSHLADDLHAVRHIGNFAAHEQKSKATGEILDVEPGEAEWNLEVLEGLFDFYFVQPAKSAARKAALNTRLSAAGKPPMT